MLTHPATLICCIILNYSVPSMQKSSIEAIKQIKFHYVILYNIFCVWSEKLKETNFSLLGNMTICQNAKAKFQYDSNSSNNLLFYSNNCMPGNRVILSLRRSKKALFCSKAQRIALGIHNATTLRVKLYTALASSSASVDSN